MIEVRDVSKSYRLFRKGRWRVLDALGFPVPRGSFEEFRALRDVSLTVPRGQRLGIIGRNGAGKSTLVKIVAGLAQPTTGTVRVSGQIQTLMELGTGFHPEFTGRDNVLAALGYQGVTGQAAYVRLEEIVEFSELGAFIDRPLKSYSAGMQARLAFSVATAMVPDILVIDEVLSAGDAYFAGKCLARMRKLTMESGATVLFVSHDLQWVQALCDRAIWLNDGSIALDGEPLHALKAYVQHVQQEEHLRLNAYRHPTGRTYETGIHARVPASLGCSEKRAEQYRVFFKSDKDDSGEAVRIESVLIRDFNLLVTACLVSGSISAGELLTVGHPERVEWQDSRVRLGPGVQLVKESQLEGLQFRLPISSGDLLARHRLVLNALPARRTKVRVLFEYKGKLACIGEILPSGDPRWREYAFDLEILSNLDGPARTSGHEPPHKSGLSWSDADPHIVSVCLMNSRGEPITGIEERTDLIVEIRYHASHPVEHPVFGMSIYLPDGSPLCRAASSLAGLHLDRLHGRGRVRFIFSPFYGGPNEYIVSVSIFKNLSLSAQVSSQVCDVHDRAYRFRVWKEFESLPDPGLVSHPYLVEHAVIPDGEGATEPGA